MNAADDERLDELIAHAIDRLLEQPGFDLDAFVRAHPEHETELRARLARLRAAGLLPLGGPGTPNAPMPPPVPAEPAARIDLLAALRKKPPLRERYEILHEIGRGGMGRVVAARDRELDRTLALKFLRTPPDDALRAEMAARFLEEARITARLTHQGIVPIHDLGIDETGALYYTMRLVEGRRTLADVFQLAREEREGWTPVRALGAILRVCDAVAYAHRRGVVHRDLKPSNVMVGPLGEVFVVDWGLSKVLGVTSTAGFAAEGDGPLDIERREGDSPYVTAQGRAVGTPYYMAPEQARGERDAVDARSDVYAAGAILYEHLTGRPPYADQGGAGISTRELLDRIGAGPPPGIEEQAPGEPAELLAICARAMARRPADRYPSIAELAADLRAFLEGRVVRAYETGAWAEARKWVRRNRALATSLAAGVVLLVVGLLSSLVLKARSDDRAAEVFRLAALENLEELEAEADEELWPPFPDRIERYRSWIARAQELTAELPRLRAKRDELRELALPWSTDQQQRDRESHPGHGRLLDLRAELRGRRGALLQRRDGVPVQPHLLEPGTSDENPESLYNRAWQRVMPERRRLGREAEGLALAELARERAGEDAAASARLLCGRAFALFALGLDHEAGRAMARAQELARVGTAERAGAFQVLAYALFAVGRDEEARKAMAEALETAWSGGWGTPTGYERMEIALNAYVDDASSPEGLRRAEEDVARVAREIEALEARRTERRTWLFSDGDDELDWWHRQLTRLVERLEELVDTEVGLLSTAGVSPRHGWSIPRRLAFAERLRAGLDEDGEWSDRWAEAIAAIREHPDYGGLELAPQVGLVPIGPDPASELWEFWQVATGEEPTRGEDGKLVLTEEMGVVLVLIPAGTFWMGAQNLDPERPNYDPDAQRDEGPVHEVDLSPFFLSKYELTQGQWLRLTGENPSGDQPGSKYGATLTSSPVITLRHPVSRISWLDCGDWLRRVGLSFPTEAQWEYGARGGTRSPWWTGSKPESLEGAANLLDQTAGLEGHRWAWQIHSWLDDGYPLHAPVGTYAANGFGLHDVAGNVLEMVRDGYLSEYYRRSQRRDPVCTPAERPLGGYLDAEAPTMFESNHSYHRVKRGGHWAQRAFSARSARRKSFPPSAPLDGTGVRPARAVTVE